MKILNVSPEDARSWIEETDSILCQSMEVSRARLEEVLALLPPHPALDLIDEDERELFQAIETRLMALKVAQAKTEGRDHL